jgi:hypothetical protein
MIIDAFTISAIIIVAVASAIAYLVVRRHDKD